MSDPDRIASLAVAICQAVPEMPFVAGIKVAVLLLDGAIKVPLTETKDDE